MTTFYHFVSILCLLLSQSIYAQCNLSNYTSATAISSSSYPYTSGGLTISATTVNTPTLTNTSYTCGGNTFTTSSPAWWLNSNTSLVTLTFSTAISSFTVIVNGTNSPEVFTFNSTSGTISLSNFCTSSFSVVGAGNQLLCSSVSATGTIITITNSIPVTQFTLGHNGLAAGSRLSVLDCFNIVPLPVQMASFTAEAIEEKEAVMLDWETISENNNQFFEVERASDGNDFESIGREISKGNSQTLQPYQFIDSNPYFGKNFYRLKTIDLMGNFHYSEIKEVRFKGNEIRIFPNPTTDIFYIEGESLENASFELIDNLGRSILKENLSAEKKIDLSKQAAGIYFLKLFLATGTKIKRIVKN